MGPHEKHTNSLFKAIQALSSMLLKVFPTSTHLPSSKATPTFLDIYYGSTPLPAFNICMSYLSLCYKLPQNLIAENKRLLPYSLDGSRISVWPNWVLYLKSLPEVVIGIIWRFSQRRIFFLAHLWDCWQDSVQILLDGGLFEFLLMGLIHRAVNKCLVGFHHSKRWQVRQKPESCCNLILKVTSHHFCLIFFVKRTSLGLAYTWGEKVTQGLEAQGSL